MKHLRFIIKYIQHIFTARWSYGFRVHSPFIYNFTRFVIYEKNPYYVFLPIEKRRNELKKDNRTIQVDDFGMGKSGEKKICDIAKKSLKSPKFSQMLFRVVKETKAQNILELGTSLGITTSYLASANKKSRCITMEGAPEIAKIALETFNSLNISNVEMIVGDINQKLPQLIEDIDKLDVVFLDANHTSKAVLAYFEHCLKRVHNDTIVIIDDIHWSKDMEYAWKKIKENKEITASIDLFYLGIVFFNKDLYKKNYKMLV